MALTLKKKIKTILSLITEPKIFISLISLRAWGYLIDMGWFNSFKIKKPVDKDNNPVPWFTYPSIDFISERLTGSMKVFEFGSGNSTLFFANKVQGIISLEHNKEWFEIISGTLPSNSKIYFVHPKTLEAYMRPLLSSDHKYDVIIIDGLFRNECLTKSLDYLNESGVLILDDSERVEYSDGINKVLLENFRQLDFWGISPGYLYKKATSIFYKSDNCLNI